MNIFDIVPPSLFDTERFIRCTIEIVRAEDLEVILYKKSEVEDPRTLEEIDRYLEEKKRQMMADVMKGASSKAEAARRLGIAPNRLHYFTEKYDL